MQVNKGGDPLAVIFNMLDLARRSAMIGYKRLQGFPAMTNPPTRARVRRTPGSQTLGAFIDRHGLRPVSVYIPEELHRALTATAIEGETSLQALMTLACHTYYGGDEANLPPLTAPTHPKQDPHKNFTWYADVDLHKKIKLLAVEIGGNAQQLILSAVVEYMKGAPRLRKLRLQTGFPAYARAPADLPKNPRAALAG